MNASSDIVKTFAVAALAASVSLGASGALPGEYVRLESVSSTRGGGQYIKTGVCPVAGQATSVEVKYRYLTVAADTHLFGYWEGFGSPNYGTAIGMANNANVIVDRLRVNATAGYYGQSNTDVHELLFNTADGTFLDGEKLTSPDLTDVKETLPSLPTADHEYYLFGRNTRTAGATDSYRWCAHATVYSCKISVGGELKRDYVPCRRLKDGVAGLYDLVSGTFCPPDGGDAFVAGKETAEKPFAIAVPSAKWVSESDGPLPEVRTAAGAVLTRGSDYTLSWLKCDDERHGYVVVTGQGAYAGSNQAASYLLEKPFVVDVPPAKWVSESEGPLPVVRTPTGTVLTRGNDYTLSWSRRADGKYAYVIVTGQGAYAGSNQTEPYSLLTPATAVPAEYRAVQRVSSDGGANGAYLKTGLHPDGQRSLEIHMKYRFHNQPSKADDMSWIFGCMDDTSGVSVGLQIGYYNMKLRLRAGSIAAYCADGFQTGDHEIRFNAPTGTYVDDMTTPATLVDGDTSIAGVVDQGTYDGAEYYLLARQQRVSKNVQPQPCAGSVYFARIWQGGELVRDYVPCLRLKDGVVGFYDLVTGDFSTSSGNQAFGFAQYADRDIFAVALPEKGKWVDETHGVEPVVADAASGKTLVRGTDYELGWMVDDQLRKAYVLITGRGAYKGANQSAAYEPIFDRSAFGDAEFVEAVFNSNITHFQGAHGALIRTGVVPNGTVPMVHIKAQMVGDAQYPVAYNTYFMGYYTDSPESGLMIGPNNDGDVLKMRYRVGTTAGFFNLTGEAVGQVHEYKFNAPGGTVIDGVNVGAPAGVADPLGGQDNLEYCLFGRSLYYNQARTSDSSRCRIYFAKFYLDGKKVRDFVPCYFRTTGTVGLFDKVTGRFFTNDNPAGGSLIAYVPCEYAEARATAATDTQNGAYVKTGIVPKAGDVPTVEMTFKWNRIIHETWLFGYWNGSTGTSIGMNNGSNGKPTYRQRVGNAAGRYDRPGDPQPETANKHTIRFNTEDGTFLDGVKEMDIDLKSKAEPSGAMEYYLFARSIKDGSKPVSPNGWTDARIYSFKLWMNGTPALDLRPMKRFPAGDAVLYDSVGQRILAPAGGTLHPGEVIEPRGKRGLAILIF